MGDYDIQAGADLEELPLCDTFVDLCVISGGVDVDANNDAC